MNCKPVQVGEEGRHRRGERWADLIHPHKVPSHLQFFLYLQSPPNLSLPGAHWPTPEIAHGVGSQQPGPRVPRGTSGFVLFCSCWLIEDIDIDSPSPCLLALFLPSFSSFSFSLFLFFLSFYLPRQAITSPQAGAK